MNNGTLGKKIALILSSNVGNDNLASELEKKTVKRINSLESVEEVKASDLATLKSAFSAASSNDPYSVSPTYYALTGRRGLWVYKDEKSETETTALLFCLHPNKQDTIIIFPPFGEEPLTATKNLINNISQSGLKFQIGRVPRDSELEKIGHDAYNLNAQVKTEDVLDWTFPVHTINCEDLVSRKGKQYGRIRQTMNKFERAGAEIRDVDFQKDLPVIEKLASSWEGNTNHYENYDLTFTEYFRNLVEIANSEPGLGLQGIIVSIDGEDKGFAIWEPALNEGNTANLFASQVSDFKMTNLATYLTVKSAEKILEDGTQYICLGGSENEGMDRYKKGFIPEKSEELETIEVEDIGYPEP